MSYYLFISSLRVFTDSFAFAENSSTANVPNTQNKQPLLEIIESLQNRIKV